MRVRPARPEDLPALRDICLRTGHLGGDATDLYRDPTLLPAVYLDPYLALEPGLAFVVAGAVEPAGPGAGGGGRADGEGPVGGYVLGARDTREFERRAEATWWPPLRDRHPLAPTGLDGGDGTRDPDAELVDLLHRPRLADPAVVAAYPSHLHVDLLPDRQGAGWGRRLLETLFDALAAAGSPGVHLGVARANERAIGFYRRMGFVELRREHGGLTMGRRLGG
jgi:GNAT superfamily N-acetyltransferase